MATPTKTQVINNGLALIAANFISDPNEDLESARQANRIYDQVVQAEIENNPWYFAKKQAALPASTQTPLYKFSFNFTLPTGFLRLVELEGRWVFSDIRPVDINPVPLYEMQEGGIFTDFPAPLNITYLSDVTSEPGLWAASFSDVVSTALAVRLAMPLTKSENMVTLAEKEYQKALRRAKHSNAIQMPPAQFPDSSWIAVRATI